jgi:hypothetical protein
MEFLRSRLLASATVDPTDLDLLLVTDSYDEAAAAIAAARAANAPLLARQKRAWRVLGEHAGPRTAPATK